MKLTLKILKLTALLILSVLIFLFSASYLLQDKVGDIIINSLNRNISTKLSVGSFRLSFLKKFPKASLELKNVLVHSSSGFDSEAFNELNTDTLFSAQMVSLEFRISDIMKGVYNIESGSARNGKINIYTDSAGRVNYDITDDRRKADSSDLTTIDLNKITLTGISGYYNNLATRLIIYCVIKDGRLKSRISGENIDFTSKGNLQIDSLQLFNTRISKTLNTDIDINLQSSSKGILFRESTLKIENWEFGINGTVSSDNMLNLNVSGNNINISRLKDYLPEKYYRVVSQYNPSGILIVNCSFNGLLNRTSNPHIEIYTLLKNGHITYGKSDIAINDLSFAGHFTNGSANIPRTSSVSVSELSATLGTSEYSGSFSIRNFEHPFADLSIKGKIVPVELKEFFDLKNISSAAGYADIDFKMKSMLNHSGKFSFSQLVDMNPEGNISFYDLTIGYNNDKPLFSHITGDMSVANSTNAKNLMFSYKGQQIKIDGDFVNLPGWLAGRPVQLIATANVSFDRLIPEAFFDESSDYQPPGNNANSIKMPGDMLLDVNFSAVNLTYKSFSSTNVNGSFNYKPRLLTFKSLNMSSMGGAIFSNGFIVQNSNKEFIIRANCNVNNIDVNSAFITFRNFGQDFIKAENLEGTLSGSFSFLLPNDSLLNPQIKALTAEAKFQLINGTLKNFDPVKELSNFIELTELEKISFDKLENDFFIRDNFIYIPQMDIKSSAADLSVNGKHSFDDEYEYHIKMLLSEILSKKRKKNNNSVTEFGTVEDDGLGRTSLLLKIENKGEVFKVGYDIKAAGSEIKNSVKTERQSLRSILNQEYGWFKSDTTSKRNVTEKSRFRINWDGSDSTKTDSDTLSINKKNSVRSPFKKK